MLLALAVAGFTAFAAACGDGPGVTGTPTPRTVPTTAGRTPDTGASATAWPGPAPRLTANITAITPTHGQQISQADTQSPDAGRPRGVCIEALFKDLPLGEGQLWFRMALDGKEVTDATGSTWLVPTQAADAIGGRFCYAPRAGFAPGRHTAAVSLQNPNNPNEPARQVVGWAFEVTQ